MEQLLRLAGMYTNQHLSSLTCRLAADTDVRLLGILNDDDPSDLGVLEKKLADKSRQTSLLTGSTPVSPSQVDGSTPQSSLTSPGKAFQEAQEKVKTMSEDRKDDDSDSEKQEEVEALSEMMCSLVTNQCGETRYIGASFAHSLLRKRIGG